MRNALIVSVGMSFRFPVSSAFMTAFVCPLWNPMLSIQVCMVLPICSAKVHVDPPPVSEVNSPVARMYNPTINPSEMTTHCAVSRFLCVCQRKRNSNVVSINIDVPAAKYAYLIPDGRQENEIIPTVNGSAIFTISRASFISFEFLLK